MTINQQPDLAELHRKALDEFDRVRSGEGTRDEMWRAIDEFTELYVKTLMSYTHQPEYFYEDN